MKNKNIILILVILLIAVNILTLLMYFKTLPKETSNTGFASGYVSFCVYRTPEILTTNQVLPIDVPVLLQVAYTNENNNNLTFYDNTSLFDINPSTGLINFTPNKTGGEEILIGFNETGNCSRSGTSKVILFNVVSSISHAGTGGVGSGGAKSANPRRENPVLIPPDFYLDRNETSLELYQGDSRSVSVTVINNVDRRIEVTVEPDLNNKIIHPVKEILILNPNEQKVYTFDVAFSYLQVPEMYAEKIRFYSRNTEEYFHVLVNGKHENYVYDYSIKIISKKLNPGERLYFNETILKLGDFRKARGEITYTVMDFDGTHYVSSHNQVTFSDNRTNLKYIEIPKDLDYGSYILYGIMNVGQLQVKASDSFYLGNVTSQIRIITIKDYFWLLVLAPTLAILALVLFYIASRKRYYRKLSFDLSHKGSSYKEIALYIKQELDRGFDEDEIRKALVSVGHSSIIINEALKEVKQKYYKE